MVTLANEENLKPFTSEQSREEAVKNGEKGGKASGEARRKKKTMKKTIEMLMQMQVTPGLAKQMESMGIDEEDATYQTRILIAMIQKAADGDVKAASFIRDTMGENARTQAYEQEVKIKKDELKLKKQIEAKQDAAQSDLIDEWINSIPEDE